LGALEAVDAWKLRVIAAVGRKRVADLLGSVYALIPSSSPFRRDAKERGIFSYQRNADPLCVSPVTLRTCNGVCRRRS
jgi:hypothetical protein